MYQVVLCAFRSVTVFNSVFFDHWDQQFQRKRTKVVRRNVTVTFACKIGEYNSPNVLKQRSIRILTRTGVRWKLNFIICSIKWLSQLPLFNLWAFVSFIHGRKGNKSSNKKSTDFILGLLNPIFALQFGHYTCRYICIFSPVFIQPSLILPLWKFSHW